jgi:hypothetical protein
MLPAQMRVHQSQIRHGKVRRTLIHLLDTRSQPRRHKLVRRDGVRRQILARGGEIPKDVEDGAALCGPGEVEGDGGVTAVCLGRVADRLVALNRQVAVGGAGDGVDRDGEVDAGKKVSKWRIFNDKIWKGKKLTSSSSNEGRCTP